MIETIGTETSLGCAGQAAGAAPADVVASRVEGCRVAGTVLGVTDGAAAV